MEVKRTFVIGDVHGQHEELRALLKRANITADDITHGRVEVVQLGDLGDYRENTLDIDHLAWKVAKQFGFKVLWGNHEQAIIDITRHSFQNFFFPKMETIQLMRELRPQYALAREGFLLTHAGLHPFFCKANDPAGDTTPGIANWIRTAARENIHHPLIDNISPARGGTDPCGSILWRGAQEPLALVPQVFGHTCSGMVRSYNNGLGFCIDVHDRKTKTLAGMWLDSLNFVAVGPDATQHEDYPPYPED